MPKRFFLAGLCRAATLAVAGAVLAGCASGPQDDLSLVPAALDDETSTQGYFTQPVRYTRLPAGCEGTCPKLVVDSLAFPGHPKLTQLVDYALAGMTWLDQERPAPYETIEEFEA
ncbi:MAG: DUF3298 domain-containing protein, partial [Castellaniella sp.]